MPASGRSAAARSTTENRPASADRGSGPDIRTRRTTDADSHFVVPDIDTFAKIEGGRIAEPYHLSIATDRLISFEVSSSCGNTKGQIAYLSGAHAEGPLLARSGRSGALSPCFSVMYIRP